MTTIDATRADGYVESRLPPPEQQPDLIFDLPELRYPARLNAAVELLDRAVEAGAGERLCLIDETGRWTYGQLRHEVGRLAAILRAAGIGRGTRVLLRLHNGRLLAALWLAVLRQGAVAVVTMPMLRRGELSAIIEKAGISHAISDDLLAAPLDEIRRESGWPATILTASALPGLAASAGPTPDPADTAAETPALIAFTSGTTGAPKGCVHSHRDVLAIADTFSRHILKPGPEDLFCGTPPLAFTFGLGGLLVFPLRARAASLLLAASGPDALAEAIARHRPTICFTAPTAYRRLSALAATHDLGSLRKAVSAGEWLPPATRDAFRQATGIELIDGIGSTEMLHIFISAAGEAIRPGATGRPVPGFRAAILDEAGNALGPNAVGRLAVKGPTGCRYLDDPRQRATVRDGWTLTGDLFLQDEDGYFRYQSRADDMIVSAGYNIAGPEVERALLTHPAIAECAVIGAPDPVRTEIVKAFVVLNAGYRPDEALTVELQNFVKSEIAPFKYPRAIEYLNALPRTATGKLQRFRLRQGGHPASEADVSGS